MTNPNNAIGTNGAYGGRTSVNAFNDNLAIYQGRGILSGFAVSPNVGMSVAIGGDGTTRDVAIAEDNIGNKTTINNISESPVVLNIAGAPASNSRIDAIVAYVDNPAQGIATETDNPSACGLIDVQGTVSATPTRPTDADIRAAITADGASGSNAYYVVLAYCSILNGMTDITSGNINQAPVQVHILDEVIDEDELFKDISADFTWSEAGILSKQVWLIASKFVLINYMGGDVTHAPGQRIADIPVAYRPASNLWEIANYAGYPGNVVIGSTGELNCNSVGSQAQGRLLFSVVYPIK